MIDTAIPIIIPHEDGEDNVEVDVIWRSCCFRLDKRVVVFSSQLLISLMIISFSLFQLTKNDTCEHQQIYIGLLTMILGVYLPQPRVH